MSEHNIVVKRGMRMKLCPQINNSLLMFSSLDKFIVRMCSLQIVDFLLCLIDFGERIVHQIRQHPTALEWWLHEDILIHRRHWISLSHCVSRLLRLASTLRECTCSMPAGDERWPDHVALDATARAAADLFAPLQSPTRRPPPPPPPVNRSRRGRRSAAAPRGAPQRSRPVRSGGALAAGARLRARAPAEDHN
jgi:hypothetical protein